MADVGECAPLVAVACQKIDNPCPTGQRCNHKLDAAAECTIPANLPPGVCWAVPIACDPADSMLGNACSDNNCFSYCALIQGQNGWYDEQSCQ